VITILLISLLLNASGTLISISGAIANALGYYHHAFLMWIISNLILLCLFCGVASNWWILNSGAWLQVLLYAIFCITSSVGYWRVTHPI
jgi:hypothetical protein